MSDPCPTDVNLRLDKLPLMDGIYKFPESLVNVESKLNQHFDRFWIDIVSKPFQY